MKFAVVLLCMATMAYGWPTRSTTRKWWLEGGSADAEVETTRYTIGLNTTATTTTPAATTTEEETTTTTSTTTTEAPTVETTSTVLGTTSETVLVEPEKKAGDGNNKGNDQKNGTSALGSLEIGLLKNVGITNEIKSQVLQAAKSGTSLLGAVDSATGEANKAVGGLGADALVAGALDQAGSATGTKETSNNVQNSVNALLDIALNGKSLLALPGVGK